MLFPISVTKKQKLKLGLFGSYLSFDVFMKVVDIDVRFHWPLDGLYLSI